MLPDSKPLFKRKIYSTLLDWKAKWSGEYALMLSGARRVGKSTIVREFARREYESHIIIDFVKPLDGTIEAFEHHYSNLDMLFASLSVLYNVALTPRKSLIVFDEVQHYPRARQLIKYLVEDGRYDYIETGSLISIRSKIEGIQNPSEEMDVRMHPMDFEEFCWALGDLQTIPFIKSCFEGRVSLGRGMHEVIMERYKSYMLVGGMPQAVSKFITTKSYLDVEVVKKGILDLYLRDLEKIPHGYGTGSRIIFERIPSMLSLHRKSFSPGMVRDGSSTDDHEASIQWLVDADLVNRCFSDLDPDISDNQQNNQSSFKCYLLDTGLLMTLAIGSKVISRQEVYEAFIKGKLSINKGMFFENAVAQALVSSGHELRFYEFYDGASSNLKEVDFIISHGTKIVPVEVKSSVSGKHASLDSMVAKYHRRIERPYVIHSKDLRVDGDLTYIPIYMAQFL